MSDWSHDLDRDGFAWVRSAFSPEDVSRMIETLDGILQDRANQNSVLIGSSGPAYGARNLLTLWPQCAKVFSSGPLREGLKTVLGPTAGVVRGLYFDKPPGHSWALPWHRDSTIAVREHRPSPAFTKPTIKAGVPHLEADESLLRSMLTVRIHLDDMEGDNGPLRVAPGSHGTTDNMTQSSVTLHCRQGDVLLMRPLLLHASGHSDTGSIRHRRILHLECAPSFQLPDDLRWHQFVPI